jgi:cobalt-precorrin 5A hydrolase
VKIAIISVTLKGSFLGEALGEKLNAEVDLFSWARGSLHASTYPFDNLSKHVAKIFYEYDGLIFIMATGIVLRVIAPYMIDKRSDPAVVVMDEAGIHAISLLSGHIGGANELTRQVAAAIGARPVITTATDIANLPAPDVIAVKMDLTIDPFEKMKAVNASIAAGNRVPYFIDKDILDVKKYFNWASEAGIELRGIEELCDHASYDAAVVITDKELHLPHLHVYLRPATLSIGIGCRRGTRSAEILAAISDACRKIGRSPNSIAIIGSTIAKHDEIGLLAAGQQLEIPLEFYTNEQLQEVVDLQHLKISKIVQKAIGVGNVCESAALLGARASRLLLPKTIYPKVTVAIAEVKSRWWESDPAME